MPPTKTLSKKPETKSTAPWAKQAAIWLVVLAVFTGIYIAWDRTTKPPVPTATAPAKPPATPFVPKHIYSETADPNAEIAAGLAQAKAEHKRVIVDFGGDWCGDCQVLDLYFHQAPNDQLLANNFVLVHVWIGHIDTNLNVPEKYGVAIHKGVPALAVLTPDGKPVYAQQGEFEDMRHMESSSVTEFLEKWKS